MADYVNLHFKNYIPDKDINEKILTENPFPSNLQEVTIMDDSVKTLLFSQTTISTDQHMEKFQEKFLQVMDPLSRLCKGLEGVRNESSEAVEVPVDTLATFIEQTTLLLGQASINLLHTWLKHLENIACWKIPIKQRHYWWKKQPYCKKVKVIYLAKNFVHT